MMVVNKKNASKIDIARSLDNVFFSDPLFDGMDVVNFKEGEDCETLVPGQRDGSWNKIASGILGYLAPKFAFHKVPRIHQQDGHEFYLSSVL
jgi:hypothetical protein